MNKIKYSVNGQFHNNGRETKSNQFFLLVLLTKVSKKESEKVGRYVFLLTLGIQSYVILI